MRVHLCRAGVVFTTLLALSAGSATSAQAVLTDNPAEAADLGGGFLARQVNADGFVPGPGGAADLSTTAGTVLALAAAEVGADAADRARDYLAAHVTDFAGTPGTDPVDAGKPGALAQLILIADALGDDPTSFGGTNLVTRLQATRRTAGTDTGLYGVQDPSFDGAFRQSLALLALNAASVAPAADAVSWLTTQQCPDGGWQAYRADTTAACANDPASFNAEDTNSTAMAVQALAALNVAPPQDAVAWLAAAANGEGGFGYFADQPTDANSTGVVIQALVSRSQAHGQADTALLALQVDCTDDPADDPGVGAFAYQPEADGSLQPNVLATVQAVPGAAGVALPYGLRNLSPDEPGIECTEPTPEPGTDPDPTAEPDDDSTLGGGPTDFMPTVDGAPILPATGPGGYDLGLMALLGVCSLGCGVLLIDIGRRGIGA